MSPLPSPDTRQLWPLAALVGVWPVLICNLALALSIASGELAPMLPYIDGSGSISMAARQDPTIYWFRIAMLPYALLLAVFWWLNHRWLGHWLDNRSVSRRVMLACGLVGAGFLALYVSFLGTDGPMYEWLRRFGAVLFFAGTAFAQLMGLRVLWHSPLHRDARYRRWITAACIISATLVLLGLANHPARLLVPEGYRIENVIEWHFGVLMNAWFVIIAVLWKRSSLTVRVSSRP